MANTGYLIYTKLKKVSDDVNEIPLDINNTPTSISGLPQDEKDNIYGQPDYVEKEYNTSSCPLPPIPVSVTVTNNPQYSKAFVDGWVYIKQNGTEILRWANQQSETLSLFAGDTIVATGFHFPDNFHTVPDSTMTLIITDNGSTVFNQTVSASTQDVELVTNEITLVAGHSYNITVSTETLDTSKTSRVFTTNTNNTANINATIIDDQSSEFELIVSPLISSNSDSTYRFNTIDVGVQTLSAEIENNNATSISISIISIDNTDTQTINANSTYTFENITKGAVRLEIN